MAFEPTDKSLSSALVTAIVVVAAGIATAVVAFAVAAKVNAYMLKKAEYIARKTRNFRRIKSSVI